MQVQPSERGDAWKGRGMTDRLIEVLLAVAIGAAVSLIVVTVTVMIIGMVEG